MSSEKNQEISKAEIVYSLYNQAEQQLVTAIEQNNQLITKTTQSLQQAQSDKIALQAQLALVRKVNERADEIVSSSKKESEPAT